MSLCGREILRLRVFEEELQTLSLFNKKPKITEITLPIEELYGREKAQQNVVLPETTDVPYVTSINVENEYMEKTPEIHGIKL